MPTDRRIFLAVGVGDLLALREQGRVDLAGRRAHTVTERVRAAYPDDDPEDLEYAALWDAVERRAGTGPVVVLAADVAPERCAPVAADDDEDAAAAYEIVLDGPLDRRSAVSLHVQAPDSGEDEELLWYDISELDAVIPALVG